MYNRVELIGIAIEVTDYNLIIKTTNHGNLKLFFSEEVNVDLIEIGKITKVIGHIDANRFPFAIVVIDSLYQINDSAEVTC